ncbi:MAG: DUF6920 family protein [Alkalispirochaetaceae bacterium]
MITYVVIAAFAGVVALLFYRRTRWHHRTRELRSRILSAEEPPGKRYDPAECAELPAPVKRYLERVLTEGQEPIASVEMAQTGSFNMSETGETWRPFDAEQLVLTRRPGFLWHARMRVLPGFSVRVHDAYALGEGVLTVSLLGAVTIAEMRDEESVAQGELLRFLAEAAWYPTALLPGPSLAWSPVDDRSAIATLADRAVQVSLLFRFSEDNLIDSVRAEARGRSVGGKTIPTPWEGRWQEYEPRNGMLVPTKGEVAWLLPEGRKPYWRGRVTEIQYRFAE